MYYFGTHCRFCGRYERVRQRQERPEFEALQRQEPVPCLTCGEPVRVVSSGATSGPVPAGGGLTEPLPFP